MICCVFCGCELSEDAEKAKLLKTFTAYQLLQAGDRACKRCAGMLSDPKFRRRCFVLKDEEFVVLGDPLAFLDHPDVMPPFVLYLTRQYRKHGWILSVQNPVLSLDKFILVVDEDRLFFEQKKYEEFRRFSEVLFERKIPKKAMLGGYPWASVIRKYGLSHEESLRLRDLQRDKLWRLCVEFRKKDRK